MNWDLFIGIGIGFLFGGAPLLSLLIISKGKGKFICNPDEWIRKTKVDKGSGVTNED